MNYNPIIRQLSPEEKIAGYISICETIRRLCATSDKTCKICMLNDIGCSTISNKENNIERAELAVLWEQENPAPVWSYKDEFLSRNPDAELDSKGYPTFLRKGAFKNAHLIGRRNLSSAEEWDEPYIDVNFEMAATTYKASKEEKIKILSASTTTPAVKHDIKSRAELNAFLNSRLMQYHSETLTNSLKSYKKFCVQSVRKVIDIRFGLVIPSGLGKVDSGLLNVYATAIDEILPELY